MITYKDINDEKYTGRWGNRVLACSSTIGIALKNNIAYGFDQFEQQIYFKHSLPEIGYSLADPSTKLLRIKEFEYSDIVLDNKYNYIIDNHFFSYSQEYWTALHSYKYFEKYLDTVRFYFEPTFEIDSLVYNTVSVHVRKGDYDGHPLYTQLGEIYYKDAVASFPRNTKFIVYSDDILWCKNSGWFPLEFFVNLDKPESIPSHLFDWCCMKESAGHIIANSSYSLSAAYLTGNPTVAPKNWFSGWLKDRCPTDDIYMPSWSVI